jgi:hypothetical protein
MEDGTMRYLITFTLMAGLTLGWADPIPSQLAKALQQRERFYHNRYVVYQVDRRLDVYKTQQKTYETYQHNFLIEIAREPKAIKVVCKPLDGQTIRTEQGTTERFHPSFGGTTACYLLLDQGIAIIGDTDAIFSIRDNSLDRATAVANIRRTRPSGIYSNLELRSSFLDETVAGMWGVFTIGLDVSKLYQARWEKVEERADRWVLIGKANAEELESVRAGAPDIVLRAELRKPDALLLNLEILTPFNQPNRWVKYQLITLQTKKADGMEIPSVFAHKSYSPIGTIKADFRYTLQRLERLKQPLRVQVPKNAVVMDERLGNTLNYRWTGRLMSEEELKRLGYQQGNLVPPSTPRRRYSPWLFLPAVLCFLAAGYLYFKNRRRLSA